MPTTRKDLTYQLKLNMVVIIDKNEDDKIRFFALTSHKCGWLNTALPK